MKRVALYARVSTNGQDPETQLLALEEFNALGVDFISLSESVDTSTPMGKMVYVVIAAVAELERSLIRERVVIGPAASQGAGEGDWQATNRSR